MLSSSVPNTKGARSAPFTTSAVESSSHRVIGQVSPGQGLPGTGGRNGRKQGLPLGSPGCPGCPGLASWITQPKMGLEQVERKKNYKSNMNESDSVVKWWDPILNCTSFNQCMGMKSTAFTPQALMISVRTET